MSTMKKTITRTLAIGMALAAFATPVLSEVTPKPMGSEKRVVRAAYDPAQVYVLRTKFLTTATIKFDDSEEIQNVALGDSKGFQFGQMSRNVLAVKASAQSIGTNMSVVTNRRTYIFDIRETASNPVFLMDFSYPETRTRKARAITPPRSNSPQYYVEKKNRGHEFMPTRIWDDGTKTYMRIPRNGAVPAVFRADAQGREYTVQVQVQNDVMIIPNISDRWVLRLGNGHICIWSTRLRSALTGQGRARATTSSTATETASARSIQRGDR